MFVKNFIEKNNLRACDAVELTDSIGLKHYAILIDEQGCNNPRFIGNLNSGVQILTGPQIEQYVSKCEITQIERYAGTPIERRNAIARAFKRLGENAYNLIFNNCEHFKNWVLYGRSESKQVVALTTFTAMAGFGATLVGLHGGNKTLEKAGKTILIVLLIIFVIAIAFLALNPKKEIE